MGISSTAGITSEQRYGSLQIQVGNGPMISPKHVIQGEGKVYALCYRANFSSSSGNGAIKVKIAAAK